MKKYSLVLLIAVLGVLTLVGSVFADGETPPELPEVEPAAEEPALPPAAVPSEETLVPSTMDAAQAEQTSLEPSDIPVAVEEASEPISGTAPAGEIVLANSEGETLDLASLESAELLSAGDPYWTVGTIKYATVFTGDPCPTGTTLNVTCWQYDDPINGALTRIEGGLVPSDKKLYIVGGTNYTENIWINGSWPGDARKSLLTGFIGMPDSLGAYPVLDGYILLELMKYGFTISNMTINGYLHISASTGAVVLDGVEVTNPAGTGITIGDPGVVRHKGSVVMKNVKSNNNNERGADIYSAGTVTVTNSTFNFNGSQGMRLNSTAGAVSINGLVARGNALSNLYVEKYETSLSVINSVLHDSVGGSGMYANSTTKAPVTVSSSYLDGNNQYGIYLQTGGTMVLSKLTITDTANHSGIFVDQTSAVSSVSVSNTRIEYSSFMGSGAGLDIRSLGLVKLSFLTSSFNSGHGVHIDNCQFDILSGKCKGSGTITLSSPSDDTFLTANYFQSNSNSGLHFISNGSVTLTNVQSDGNAEYGLYLNNYNPAATLTTNKTLKYWFNSFDSNSMDGIYVTGPGHVSLAYTNSSYNGGYGFYSTSNVKNISAASGEFSGNTLSGMWILSSGNVTLNGVNASENNYFWPGDHYGVYIDNTTGNGNITINPSALFLTNAMNWNDIAGLYIKTKGVVSISNVEANHNSEFGIYMDNSGAITAKTITLAKATANDNYDGIYAKSIGAITFNTITASDNTDDGVTIDGCPGGTCTRVVNFTLGGSGSTFNNNGNDGLGVYTKGAITLTNVSARGNYYGVWLDNNYVGVLSSVKIGASGSYRNTIEENTYGLWIDTRGDISLTRVLANKNLFGASLDNSDAIAARKLTMTNCDFNSNEATGLFTDIRGSIIANSLIASYNSIHNGVIDEINGAVVTERLTSDTRYDIWNIYNANGGYNISLSTSSFDPAFEVWNADTNSLLFFVDNFGMTDTESIGFILGGPMNIYVKVFGYGQAGEYTLDVNGGPVAALPAYHGAHLTNFGGTVTVTSSTRGLSQFEDNNLHGLFIESTGIVNVNNLTAENNGGHGVFIDADSDVTIKGTDDQKSTSFSNNGMSGMHVNNLGSITISRDVEANGNGGPGFYLDNSAALTAKTIYVVRAKAQMNGGSGFEVYGSGAITIDAIESFYNSSAGAYVDNSTGFSGLVTVKGNNRVISNYGYGLYINALSSTSVAGVRADNNAFDGIRVISASGTTSIVNCLMRYNAWSGITVNANGHVNMSGTRSINNGDNFLYGDGARIVVAGAGNISIKDSVFQINYGNGIDVTLGTGWLSLSNTSYFGNDYTSTGLYDDLYVN